MVFFCGFDFFFLNTICYASFQEGDFYSLDLQIFELGVSGFNFFLFFFNFFLMFLPVLRLWVLWPFVTDRERVRAGLEYFLTCSWTFSKALLLSTTTILKIPCSLQCFQSRSQTSYSRQRHSPFPSWGSLAGAGSRAAEPATHPTQPAALDFIAS